MKSFWLLFVVLPAMPVLTGCSGVLHATLFNNTGVEIEVHAAREREMIAPNRFAKFEYPQERDNRVFRLSSEGCEYLYDIPDLPNGYPIPPGSDRGGQIQVEKDFSIDLLPAAYAGDAPVASDMVLHREGFPLRPVSKKCR